MWVLLVALDENIAFLLNETTFIKNEPEII